LAILAPHTLVYAAPSFVLMLLVTGLLVLLPRKSAPATDQAKKPLSLGLQSPFSLRSAIQFGALFLALEVAGTLAQRWVGRFGFFAVCFVGGMFSSASSVASAGSLAAHGTLPADIAGTGAVLAAITSVLVDLPLVARIARERPLTRRTAVALGLIALAGVIGAFLRMRISDLVSLFG
jgi:uncharacterized membrane protein (DUF4010 family)